MCYHAEFGRSALKGVGIYKAEPHNWEHWNKLSWEGGVADPLIHVPPPRYHVKVGSSATTGVRINRKPQNYSAGTCPWDGGVTDP